MPASENSSFRCVWFSTYYYCIKTLEKSGEVKPEQFSTSTVLLRRQLRRQLQRYDVTSTFIIQFIIHHSSFSYDVSYVSYDIISQVVKNKQKKTLFKWGCLFNPLKLTQRHRATYALTGLNAGRLLKISSRTVDSLFLSKKEKSEVVLELKLFN